MGWRRCGGRDRDGTCQIAGLAGQGGDGGADCEDVGVIGTEDPFEVGEPGRGRAAARGPGRRLARSRRRWSRGLRGCPGDPDRGQHAQPAPAPGKGPSRRPLIHARQPRPGATPGSTPAVRSPHSADVGKSHEIKHDTPVRATGHSRQLIAQAQTRQDPWTSASTAQDQPNANPKIRACHKIRSQTRASGPAPGSALSRPARSCALP